MKQLLLSLVVMVGLIGEASAAARFWVGGTGTWDATAGSKWATSSGGTGGASVPTTGDDVTFDNGAGGSGIVTVNTTVNVNSITMSAFVGTLDFATNNNNVTLTANGGGFASTGSAVRTLNMGNGTWNLSNGNGLWDIGGSNFTLNANSSTISFTGTSTSQARFNGGGKTYNIITIAGSAGQCVSFTGSNTIGTLTLGFPMRIAFDNTQTITTLTNIAATASSPIIMENSSPLFNSANTLAVTNNFTVSFAAITNLTFSGGTHTANNSFNIGRNSGITINPPSGGTATITVGGFGFR